MEALLRGAVAAELPSNAMVASPPNAFLDKVPGMSFVFKEEDHVRIGGSSAECD